MTLSAPIKIANHKISVHAKIKLSLLNDFIKLIFVKLLTFCYICNKFRFCGICTPKHTKCSPTAKTISSLFCYIYNNMKKTQKRKNAKLYCYRFNIFYGFCYIHNNIDILLYLKHFCYIPNILCQIQQTDPIGRHRPLLNS
jgi:hypothetical protein